MSHLERHILTSRSHIITPWQGFSKLFFFGCSIYQKDHPKICIGLLLMRAAQISPPDLTNMFNKRYTRKFTKVWNLYIMWSNCWHFTLDKYTHLKNMIKLFNCTIKTHCINALILSLKNQIIRYSSKNALKIWSYKQKEKTKCLLQEKGGELALLNSFCSHEGLYKGQNETAILYLGLVLNNANLNLSISYGPYGPMGHMWAMLDLMT